MSGPARLDGAGIITGGGGAIGQATALLLLEAGARVVLADSTWRAEPEQPDDLHAQHGDRIHRETADVRRFDEMRRLVRSCQDRFGRIDFMIANAAVGDSSLLADGDAERWQTVVETNVLGLAYTVRAVLPVMRDQGHGHIVVMASLSGRISYVGEALYATSKWAAVGLAGVLRKEALGYGVRTTLIEPGLVDTPFSRASPLGREELGQVQPLTPTDVAATIVFALAQPPHVNLTEIVIQPTDEAY